MFKSLKAAFARGFTLIELVVTLVVIGILGAISIAGYSAVMDKAEEQAIESTLSSIDREYRALDAFTMADGSDVAVADMTDVNDVDGALVYNDGGDAELGAGDTVEYTVDGVTGTLTLGSATEAGTIEIAAASDDGSSESADPYAGWESWTQADGTEIRWTVERTGLYDLTVHGAYVGVTLDAPRTEGSNGGICITFLNEGCHWAYDMDGDLVLETDGTWEFSYSLNPADYPFNNSNYDLAEDLVWYADYLAWGDLPEWNNSEWAFGKPYWPVPAWNG